MLVAISLCTPSSSTLNAFSLELLDTTQESWCDKIDRSVPSEKYMQDSRKPSDEEKDTRTDPLVDENPSPDEYRNSGASRLLTNTLLAVVTILTALLMA
jgi:hypothetical protein